MNDSDRQSLKYWAKEARRAEQWLRAPAKNKPKSERSIRKWTARRDNAQLHVAYYTGRILRR